MKNRYLSRLLAAVAIIGIGLLVPSVQAEFVDDPDFKLNGDAEKGEVVYKRICIACHGELGDGKGPAGVALNPTPGNFTDPKRMAELSDKYIQTIVTEGGMAVGKSPLMAPWGAALSDQEVLDVGEFIKTFSIDKE